jgi:pimeloyl-ACP methyl ester carboxylesterase
MNEFFLDDCGISYRMNEFFVSKKSIVFIHGITGSCSAWFEYERVLQDKYNILTLDLRGHGMSRKYKYVEDYSIERCALDIVEVLKRTKFEKFSIVSHSFGTIIAVELLAILKGRVEAAIFLSPAYDIKSAKSRRLIPVLKLAAAIFRVLPFSSSSRGRTDYSKFRNTGDWNVLRMFADIQNTTLRTHLFCLIQIFQYDQKGKWDCLVPTLVFHGRKDHLIPIEHTLKLKMLNPSIKLILLERADHILILNNTVEISHAIFQFVSEGHC